MTRPAVVVGLGGTGQWVLTYLKREMLIAGRGNLPSNLRFLAFDTMPKPDVAVKTVQSAQQEAIAVGSIQLTGEEFIHIGGNAFSISERLQSDDAEYKHIAKWFRNREWRRTFPSTAWNLDDGAGRIRQLGRLATFKDLLNLQAGSKVWRALKKAIEDVKSQGQVSESQPLELILVGSFAGGTGSGCFLDIALLLRHLARGIPHSLRAYFVLPTAFNNEPTNEMLARSFAAWRELNRFMLVNPDFPIRVDYSSEDTQFQVLLDKRLFDVCYLVDGYRMGSPLNTDPRDSVFPSIAEAVATLLDDAGTEYVRTILTNLLPEYTRRPSVPLYSGLGSYGFKVPAYYLQQEGGHQFSLEVLRALLGWKSGSGQRTVARADNPASDSSERLKLLVAPDQNQEIGIGNAGRKEVSGFLSSTSLRYKDETANPTTFTAKIAHIAREGGIRNQSLIEEHANAVLNPIRSNRQEDPSWLRPFTDLGEDPNNQKLRNEVQTEVSLDMVQQFGRRQGDTNKQAMKRQEGITKFVFDHYGGDTSTGEVDGLFGETLARCQRFHVDLFKHMLQIWTVRTLMGTSNDPIIARGGKLGYIYDFFDGLVDTLEQIRLFMQTVQTQREENRPRLKLEGLAESARKIAQGSANKKFFWVFENPGFEKDLNAFLQVQQRLVNLRKEELLHKYVVRTLEILQQVVQQARAEIERWIWHLGTGDAATGTIGLYDELEKSLNLVRANHAVERQLSGDPLSERPGIQQLLHDEEITQVEADEVVRALARLEWSASMYRDQLVLQAAFQPGAEGDPVLSLVNPATAQSEEQRVHFSERNLSALTAISSRGFEKPMQGLQAAQLVMTRYPDPGRFAEDILDKRAEPLIDVSTQDAPKRSAILRVAHMYSDTARSYFRQVEERLRAAKQAGEKDDTFFIQAINTTNPFVCTLVRTDELFQYRRFKAWEKCQSGFDSYIFTEGQDPTLLHNFAAESNAARYEQLLASSGQQRRALHPWVVMLLEEEVRFRQAIYCILMGLFAPVESGEAHIWELELPKTSGGTLEITLSRSGKPEEMLFQALYNFIIRGQDIRPGYGQLRVYPVRPDQTNLVSLAIRRKQEEWGRQREVDEWKRKLDRDDPTTFLSWLRECAVDNLGNTAHEEFDDLATLIDIILRERVSELGEDESPDGTPVAPLPANDKRKISFG
jgi:hypothetical protein